jgi:hypothetical protein
MLTEANLLADIARALLLSIDSLPANLTDKQLEVCLGLAVGTIGVKRCRGNFPIPSYRIGRARRTPLSAVIEFKLAQIQEQVKQLEGVKQ